MTMTTIKVSSDTRDRLKGQASAAGESLGDYLTRLATRAEREARFAAMRSAYASSSPEVIENYWRETHEWLDADLSE